MNNLNLLGKEWTNIVFENRNKLYGAYKLRQESGQNTFIALAIGLALISFGFGSSYLYASTKNTTTITSKPEPTPEKVVLVETNLVEKMKPKVEKPLGTANVDKKAVATKADVMDNKKLTDITIDKDQNVKTNDLTAQNEFNDRTNSSTVNVNASANGSLNTNGTKPGTQTTTSNNNTGNGAINGSNTLKPNEIVRLVQKKAAPAEGFNKFYELFIRKFSKNPSQTQLSEVVIKLRFVVEKDGSFTDIQIVEDQLGMGQEAVRVLKAMPKWQPAEHNGNTVRSMFTLPIKIKINN
ncbi:energy transducer TonB [Myroides sp. JBRI-B21084]|uniref:energy transducer TonB n=1 Tax=Myroides sp. JBRI-B21084 TaxID=3119977 RepID=UPI0026E27673|nr:energy transducer TonB [Paenimyroides cloacae]WKW47223.1 energy transducer TonB [Paenimyroides cloacae]